MQRFLLDTHVLLWWLTDTPQLGVKARKTIAEVRNTIYVSAATSWEISIKQALGKLKVPADIENIVEDEGFEKLPISFYHGQLAGNLPDLHRDPFDRMLIAQAQAEGLIIITGDERIMQYTVQMMNAGR